MTRALLEKGAAKDAHATLRKLLDWTEKPRWHEAHGVTATEWGRGFPKRAWINAEGLQFLS